MTKHSGEELVHEDDYVRVYEVRVENAPEREYVVEHKLMEGRGDRFLTRFQFGKEAQAPSALVIPEVAFLEILRHRLKQRLAASPCKASASHVETSLAIAQRALVNLEIMEIHHARNEQFKKTGVWNEEPA